MSGIAVQGIAEVERTLARIDRKVTRERQLIIRRAATRTIAPAMRSRAKASPGKAGGQLARAVSARNGRDGAVVVGPRGGRRGAWWRHIFIGGAKAHEIGGAKGAWGRYAGRGRRFLFSPGSLLAVTGPIPHPGVGSNPFVEEAAETARPAFVKAVSAALFTDRKET